MRSNLVKFLKTINAIIVYIVITRNEKREDIARDIVPNVVKKFNLFYQF
jgi:hypothetical protein